MKRNLDTGPPRVLSAHADTYLPKTNNYAFRGHGAPLGQAFFAAAICLSCHWAQAESENSLGPRCLVAWCLRMITLAEGAFHGLAAFDAAMSLCLLVLFGWSVYVCV